jgi:chromate transporter
VKALLLFLLLLKGTATSFAGLASLPVIREELVLQRHMVTDDQLNAAVVVTRTTPGPVGLWVVSIGYFADGVPGAIAGWLAMITPSLLVILLLGYFGKRAEHPRLRGMLQCVVLASAALLIVSAVPLAKDALTTPFLVVLAALCLPVLLSKKFDTLWIIGGAAAITLVQSLVIVGVVPGL